MGAVTKTVSVTTDLTAPPFATSVSANGRYLLDQYGQPFLLRGDSQWDLFIWGGGRSEPPGTPQGVFDAYASIRASKGFNSVLLEPLSSNQGGQLGPYQDGRTWDGIPPWGAGGIGDLNEAYWARLDGLLTALESNGITAVLNVISQYVLYAGTACAGLNTTNAATLGTALGSRYKNRPNIIWVFGVDYFGTFDTEFATCLAAMRAAGDTHLCSVEYHAETTTREVLVDGSANGTWMGGDIEDVYTYWYNYVGCEIAYSNTPARPTLLMNGHYDQTGTSGQYDLHVMSDQLGWALTSGSVGYQYGSAGTWSWTAAAYANLTAEIWPNGPFPAVMDRIKALNGWWDLVPDFSSTFLTGSRGTKGTAIATGANEYTAISTQNDYLTGAVTADGRLGLIYTPTARTITIDTSKMQAGFTAKWMDPVTGALTSTTPGASYTHPGNNSAGLPNWYLVLEA